MREKERTLSVSAIKNGTVIDHIPSGASLKILQLIDCFKDRLQVTIGLHLKSSKMKFKDIIKIQEKHLSESEIHQIAILAPNATVNIIQNYKVVKKIPISLPETIESLLTCPSPKCITNHEKVSSFFYLQKEKGDVFLRCKYCEKSFKESEFRIRDL